jgi:hypothetical protein
MGTGQAPRERPWGLDHFPASVVSGDRSRLAGRCLSARNLGRDERHYAYASSIPSLERKEIAPEEYSFRAIL